MESSGSRVPPRVSVIVPAFNAARYLPEALESVRLQSFKDWECLVVDDGSDDETGAVAGGFVSSDARFRYRRQANRGRSAARNEGIAATAGELVQFLDADDAIGATKLEAQVARLDARPEAQVCYSNYRPFDDSGLPLDRFGPVRLGPEPLEDFLFRWEHGLSIPIHAALIRRPALRGPEVFNPALDSREDWLVWVRLAAAGAIFDFLDEELAFYRMHDKIPPRDLSAHSFLKAAAYVAQEVPAPLKARFLEESRRYAEELLRVERRRLTPGDDPRLRLEPLAPVSGPSRRRPSPRAAELSGCTIAFPDELESASVLARSFREHHRAPFTIHLVGGAAPSATPLEGVRLVRVPVPPEGPLLELLFLDDRTQVRSRLTPGLLSGLLDSRDADAVVYLDPTGVLLRPLEELRDALEERSVVFSPRVLFHVSNDGARAWEDATEGTETFALMAIRPAPESRRLLSWWESRVAGRRRPDGESRLEIAIGVLGDPAYNLGLENLSSRKLRRQDGRFFVGGRPLVHFDSRGLGEAEAEARPESAVFDLLRLARAPREATDSFSAFENGIPINLVFRELYRSLPVERRSDFANPFRVGHGSFFEWAVSSPASGNDLSPFLQTLYRLRPDVADAYPQVCGSDRGGFLAWAATSGAREMGYDAVRLRISEAS